MQIDCQACKLEGGMAKAKVAKFSLFIQFIGGIIAIPSFFGMLIGGMAVVNSFAGNAPGEASREAQDEDLLHESESVSTDDEEDDFGFDEFDDDYSDDDLSDYNEYEY